MRPKPPRRPRVGALAIAALALSIVACAAPAPLCPRSPDAGFSSPKGPTGAILAEYVHAFDSGDPAAMQAYLTARFGDAYKAYRASVRRYL
jgi:hypothetical protein